MARVLADEVTIEEYLALLERLYGFHLPLEEHVSPHAGGFDYAQRRKTPPARRS